jgi:SAM-dependent methyltransferase
MFYGGEKAFAEQDRRRRFAYRLVGEIHVPGRLRVWHVIRELRRLGVWSARPVRLLDAGGGAGAFAYFIARTFPSWRVVVADNDVEAIERGTAIKERLGLKNLELRRVDLCELDDETGYDVVVCSDVLEHIPDDVLAVKQMARALRPGGRLIVTSPGQPQPRHLPLVAWRERRIGFSSSDYGHVRPGYSRESLSLLFANAGLDAEHIRWTFGPFGTLMFDLFFVAGDSHPHPVVYGALFPLYMLLSGLDVMLPSRHGAAILGVARRP